MNTLSPEDFSQLPIDHAAIPLPSDEQTPPVTNIYFGMTNLLIVNIGGQWRLGLFLLPFEYALADRVVGATFRA